MSDRAAETGHEGATVCPFVAFQDDRERRATDPDHRHRCYAELLPAPRAIAHQRRYCLSPEFPSCPIFQDWAIRAAATGVSMPSARSVTGPPPPIAPHAGGVNGSGKRTPDWAAPPPWVDAAGEPPGVPTAPSRGQLTAFDDQRPDGEGGGDGEGDGEAPMSGVVAARDRTGARRQTTRASGGTGAGGTTDDERARSGRGFAYDLIADDPAFAAPPDGDEGDEGEIDDEAKAERPTAMSERTADGEPTPPTGPHAPPREVQVAARRGSHPPSSLGSYPPPAAGPGPQPPPVPAPPRSSVRTAGSTGLPEPEYLPPVKQMATPAGRQMRTGPFEGERDWERPRRFEAYPTLRTRVGMPGLPRLGRLPPVAVGGIALVLAAAILFALPGLFAGGPGGGGASSPTPPTSARPTVTPSPSTPVPATPQVYIVKRGDTFSGIASRFNLTLDELKAANPQITNINALRVGDRINIPDPFASPPAGASEIPSPTASATQ